jgi:hypothetical protein
MGVKLNRDSVLGPKKFQELSLLRRREFIVLQFFYQIIPTSQLQAHHLITFGIFKTSLILVFEIFNSFGSWDDLNLVASLSKKG